MGGRRKRWERTPAAGAMRRRALHCLRDTHWDPFERHVLRLIADHAYEIATMRQRIVKSSTSPRGRLATRRDLKQVMDKVLSTFTPEHVALAKPLLDLPGSSTPTNLLAGLLSQAVGMLSDIGTLVTGERSSGWELSRGMEALRLRERALHRLFLDRAEDVILGSPSDVVHRMATLATIGDPEGKAIREAGADSRKRRARHYARFTIQNVERELARTSWLFDEIVAERMRLETWSFGEEGPDNILEIHMKVVLTGVTEWRLSTRVNDHGILPASTSNKISNIKHDGAILLGRRIDRDARGLPEDHPSMAAAPLVAALRWRADPGEVPIDTAATVHLEDDVRLSEHIIVRARVADTCWIEVDQTLPDVVIAAMAGRPLTDLIAHPWLDPRIIVKDSLMSSRGVRFLVEMPRARLMPVDEDDADPVEEWQALQNRQCITRQERRRDDGARAGRRSAAAADVRNAPGSHNGDASRTIGARPSARRRQKAIRRAVLLILLMLIAASLAVLTR